MNNQQESSPIDSKEEAQQEASSFDVDYNQQELSLHGDKTPAQKPTISNQNVDEKQDICLLLDKVQRRLSDEKLTPKQKNSSSDQICVDQVDMASKDNTASPLEKLEYAIKNFLGLSLDNEEDQQKTNNSVKNSDKQEILLQGDKTAQKYTSISNQINNQQEASFTDDKEIANGNVDQVDDNQAEMSPTDDKVNTQQQNVSVTQLDENNHSMFPKDGLVKCDKDISPTDGELTAQQEICSYIINNDNQQETSADGNVMTEQKNSKDNQNGVDQQKTSTTCVMIATQEVTITGNQHVENQQEVSLRDGEVMDQQEIIDDVQNIDNQETSNIDFEDMGQQKNSSGNQTKNQQEMSPRDSEIDTIQYTITDNQHFENPQEVSLIDGELMGQQATSSGLEDGDNQQGTAVVSKENVKMDTSNYDQNQHNEIKMSTADSKIMIFCKLMVEQDTSTVDQIKDNQHELSPINVKEMVQQDTSSGDNEQNTRNGDQNENQLNNSCVDQNDDRENTSSGDQSDNNEQNTINGDQSNDNHQNTSSDDQNDDKQNTSCSDQRDDDKQNTSSDDQNDDKQNTSSSDQNDVKQNTSSSDENDDKQNTISDDQNDDNQQENSSTEGKYNVQQDTSSGDINVDDPKVTSSTDGKETMQQDTKRDDENGENQVTSSTDGKDMIQQDTSIHDKNDEDQELSSTDDKEMAEQDSSCGDQKDDNQLEMSPTDGETVQQDTSSGLQKDENEQEMPDKEKSSIFSKVKGFIKKFICGHSKGNKEPQQKTNNCDNQQETRNGDQNENKQQEASPTDEKIIIQQVAISVDHDYFNQHKTAHIDPKVMFQQNNKIIEKSDTDKQEIHNVAGKPQTATSIFGFELFKGIMIMILCLLVTFSAFLPMFLLNSNWKFAHQLIDLQCTICERNFNGKLSKIELEPWNEGHEKLGLEKPLQSMYIDQRFYAKNGEINFSSLLQAVSENDSKYSKRYLLIAEQGSGKTTAMKSLVQDWCNKLNTDSKPVRKLKYVLRNFFSGEWDFTMKNVDFAINNVYPDLREIAYQIINGLVYDNGNTFDKIVSYNSFTNVEKMPILLFAFEFKDIINIKTLTDTIFQEIIKDSTFLTKKELEGILKREIKHILLVLDGWDEYTKLKYKVGAAPEMEAIVYREEKKNINLIVSTRSWRSDELLSVPRFGFERLFIADFRIPEDRDIFIHNFFPDGEEAIELINILNEKDTIVPEELIRQPRMLLYICNMWKNNKIIRNEKMKNKEIFWDAMWKMMMLTYNTKYPHNQMSDVDLMKMRQDIGKFSLHNIQGKNVDFHEFNENFGYEFDLFSFGSYSTDSYQKTPLTNDTTDEIKHYVKPVYPSMIDAQADSINNE